MLLFGFHVVVITTAGLFPSTVVSVNLHAKEPVPRVERQQAVSLLAFFFLQALTLNSLFRELCSTGPFSSAHHIPYEPLPAVSCATKAERQSHAALSQSEYFHQQLPAAS